MECLLKKQESFQGELAKRILKWPIHQSNIYCRYDLSRFMHQDFGVQAGFSCEAVMCDDFGESCFVRECRELEDVLGTNFTGQILSECSGM